jgi:hypothetical protein
MFFLITSVSVKMEMERSSETSEHLTATRHRNPKEGHHLISNGRESLETVTELLPV